MKRVILLSIALCALSAFASSHASESFEERVFLARDAEEDERFHPYPAQVVREASPHIARTMRSCWRQSPRNPKPFVLIADIGPDGRPRNVEVKPAHASARCFAAGFSAARYLVPPEYPDRAGFPVTMRVGGN